MENLYLRPNNLIIPPGKLLIPQGGGRDEASKAKPHPPTLLTDKGIRGLVPLSGLRPEGTLALLKLPFEKF